MRLFKLNSKLFVPFGSKLFVPFRCSRRIALTFNWESVVRLLINVYTKYTYSVHFKIAFVCIKVHINKSEIDQCRTLETDIRLHCCTSQSWFYGYWYMICVRNMHDSSLLVEENCMDVRWMYDDWPMFLLQLN